MATSVLSSYVAAQTASPDKEPNVYANEVSLQATTPTSKGVLSTQNLAILLVVVAFLYLGIMLYQICLGDTSDSSLIDEDEDYYLDEKDYDSEYYGYTNSNYLKSDKRNSLVDHGYY